MHSLGDALIGDWRSAAFAGVKALALFLTAAAAFRLTERRTIAQFAPFDWAVAVAVGAIIGRTATASDSSWLTGAVALVVLLLAHSLIARLRFLPAFRHLVDPPVRELIRDGEVNQRNLRLCGITRADLDSVLRQQGHSSPDTVALALFEAKGSVSVQSGTGPSSDSDLSGGDPPAAR
ncbi:DUF421 domain-containing protein [Mangrovihabitans endophyticus]|uniref:YetF C-terminal domain-containing protein n=1 Tax=Mangrovihabitans endophyticus TaxID=1751298 RepID=A0A8J3BYN2_9ACTN|nr:YetF domain-containing protein [Mangrovihabitans endophyticus]GGK81251.1 hypothetical protein GCM10012284_14010 [Mangrovihabitans endophyticus]